MKKNLLCFLLFLFVTQHSYSQQIVNLIYVGDKGVTEDIKETKFFIAIKQFPEGKYQRLDYKLHGPLITVKSYSDSALKILDGNFYTYRENGSLQTQGTYNNNKKSDSWYYYDDALKVVKEEKYKEGVLLETIDLDTVKEQKEILYGDEREAEFKGGQKAWIKFLSKAINPDIGSNSVKGGTVNVGFRINKEGGQDIIHIRKSVEFILDEEALRVINSSPKWIPAFQNGHTVNAYRAQPLTFAIVEK